MSNSEVRLAKVVLFDLGDTLEHEDSLLPGAAETLATLADLRDQTGRRVVLALVSDFTMPSRPEELPSIQHEYVKILEKLGIRRYFEPIRERITLSSEVGVHKPDPAVFERVLAKLGMGLTYRDLVFVTENREHVRAARALGMRGVHFQGPGQTSGEIQRLTQLVPIVLELLGSGFETRAERTSAWIRLGDRLLLLGSAGSEADASRAGRDGVQVLHTARAPEQLRLVVQTGRAFQRDHPDVSVVVDKGRYLIVEADAGAGRLQEEGVCYSVSSVEPGEIVMTELRGLDGARPRIPWIQDLVNALSRESFDAGLRSLTAHPTRFSSSAHFATAADWVEGDLRKLGFATRRESVTVPGGTSANVIGERVGRGAEPRALLVLTAHLDSINHQGGPNARAPGADDNASGSAGLLAIAQVLASHESEHDLRVVFFGGEEQNLLGSRRHVRSLSSADRSRIRAVVNMDMVAARNSSVATVLLEGAEISRQLIAHLAECAATYTGLEVQTSLHAANSDHVPFIEADLPAVLTIEGTDSANSRIHTENDTVEFLDVDLALDILRMNVAFSASVLGRRVTS